MKSLLLLFCALAAVNSAKLPTYPPEGSQNPTPSFSSSVSFERHSNTNGIPLPVASEISTASSLRQNYVPPSSQRFSSSSNSVASTLAQNSLLNPTRSPVQATSQFSSGLVEDTSSDSINQGSRIITAIPERSYSLPSSQASSSNRNNGQSLLTQNGQSFAGNVPQTSSTSNTISSNGFTASQNQRESNSISLSHNAGTQFEGQSAQSYSVPNGQSSSRIPEQSQSLSNIASSGSQFQNQPSNVYSRPTASSQAQSLNGFSNPEFNGQQFSSNTNGQSFTESAVEQSVRQPQETYTSPNNVASQAQRQSSEVIQRETAISQFGSQPSQTYSGPSSQTQTQSNGQSFSGGRQTHLQQQQIQHQPGQQFSGVPLPVNNQQSVQSSHAFNTQRESVHQETLGVPLPVNGNQGSHAQQANGIIRSPFTESSNFDRNGREYSENRQATATSHESLDDDELESQRATCPEGQVLHVDGRCVVPEVTRNVFVYASPKQDTRFDDSTLELPPPKVEHNIVFIRNPEGGANQDPIVVPPPQQKHVIYVLNEESEFGGQRVIEVPAPEQKTPEVYFVNYAEGENPTLPDGTDFETALNSAISADGQIIGSTGVSQHEETLNGGFQEQNNFIGRQETNNGLANNGVANGFQEQTNFIGRQETNNALVHNGAANGYQEQTNFIGRQETNNGLVNNGVANGNFIGNGNNGAGNSYNNGAGFEIRLDSSEDFSAENTVSFGNTNNGFSQSSANTLGNNFNTIPNTGEPLRTPSGIYNTPSRNNF